MEAGKSHISSSGLPVPAAPVEAHNVALAAAQCSPAVQEIISGRPGYIVRNGNLIVVLVVALLLLASWAIRYPDSLQGTATITTDPKPMKLQFPAAGRLRGLFVDERADVRRDMPVAESENGTGYDAILRLSATADSVLAALQRGDLAALDNIQRSPLSSLGEGQAIYNALLDAIGAYVTPAQGHIYQKRVHGLRSQISRYQSLSEIDRVEQALIDEELRQAGDRYKANEQLYSSKVISRQEYYDEAARLRARKLALEGQRKASLQNNIAIADNSRQLEEARFEQKEKEAAQLAAIKAQVRNLRNFVQEWKQRYLVVAPFDGKVHYSRRLETGETIATGESIGSIVPSSYRHTALIVLPAHGSGKLAIGQEVQLYVDQYPGNEYGYISARVEDIAAIPQAEKGGMQYQIRARMEDRLRTSHNKTLPFAAELNGKAVVITKERNLLERLFSAFIQRS